MPESNQIEHETAPTTSEAPNPKETDAFMRVRVGRILIPILVFSAVFLVTMVIWIIYIASTSFNPGDKAVSIKVVQIISGIVIGFICVCLGFIMSWFGITGAFSLGAAAPGGKLKVEATHIGLALLVGGMLLMGLALNSTVAYSETSSGGVIMPILEEEGPQ